MRKNPITAALELHGKLDADSIESITLDTYWVAKRHVNRDSPLWNPSEFRIGIGHPGSIVIDVHRY